MPLFRFFGRLTAIGRLLTFVGQLITQLGSSPSLTEIVREGERPGSDQPDIPQDSVTPTGGTDEEPEGDQDNDRSSNGDLFETTE